MNKTLKVNRDVTAIVTQFAPHIKERDRPLFLPTFKYHKGCQVTASWETVQKHQDFPRPGTALMEASVRDARPFDAERVLLEAADIEIKEQKEKPYYFTQGFKGSQPLVANTGLSELLPKQRAPAGRSKSEWISRAK